MARFAIVARPMDTPHRDTDEAESEPLSVASGHDSRSEAGPEEELDDLELEGAPVLELDDDLDDLHDDATGDEEGTGRASAPISSLPTRDASTRNAPDVSLPVLRDREATGVAQATALSAYMSQLRHYAPISREEEHELAVRWTEDGDVEAAKLLVLSNLRLVVKIAMEYRRAWTNTLDLIQEGNVGLVTAARKFDVDQGVKFISYAVWWIRQAILAALANQGRAVRVPLNRASDLARIFRERERLKQELGREPTVTEVGEAALLTPEVVQSLQTLNAAEIRLDAPIGESEDSQLVERFMFEEAMRPEEEVEDRLLAEHIERALDTLTPRDARVVRLYFGLDGGREHTLEEIGNMLGVTRERVRQLRDRALKRLREGELGTALESFAA